jgi:hypothetical protein
MRWTLGRFTIAALIVWIGVVAIPGAYAAIDAPALKFLPPQTDGIAVVDVAALRGTLLFQEALKGNNTLPQPAQEFIDATGIDLKTDLDKVTIAKIGPQSGLAVLQGRFDKFKVAQYLKEKGSQPDSYLGQTLYRERDGAVVLLDNIVLLGQIDVVKKAIDQMQLPGSQPLSADLMAAINTIDTGSQFWAAGNVTVNDLPPSAIDGPGAQVSVLLKSLQTGTIQMRVDNGIHARIVGNFGDASSARTIEDLARGMFGLVRLQLAQKQPDMVQILDGLQFSSSGNALTIRIDESEELLKKLQDSRTATLLKK